MQVISEAQFGAVRNSAICSIVCKTQKDQCAEIADYVSKIPRRRSITRPRARSIDDEDLRAWHLRPPSPSEKAGSRSGGGSACLSRAHHESDPRGDTRCILASAGADGLHSRR